MGYEQTAKLTLDLFTATDILASYDDLDICALTDRQELEHDAMCDVVNELTTRATTPHIGYLFH